MGLLLDVAGSHGASLNEVLMVPPPPPTRSYAPVSNRDLVDLIDERTVKKHTVNVWQSVTEIIDTAIMAAATNYQALDADFCAWKAVEVQEARGAELIGRALYDGVLAPQQATIAMADWRNARHEQFADRTAWSLYNCYTEAVKKGPAGAQINRSTGVHDWFRGQHQQAWRTAA